MAALACPGVTEKHDTPQLRTKNVGTRPVVTVEVWVDVMDEDRVVVPEDVPVVVPVVERELVIDMVAVVVLEVVPVVERELVIDTVSLVVAVDVSVVVKLVVPDVVPVDVRDDVAVVERVVVTVDVSVDVRVDVPVVENDVVAVDDCDVISQL